MKMLIAEIMDSRVEHNDIWTVREAEASAVIAYLREHTVPRGQWALGTAGGSGAPQSSAV